MSFPIFSKYKSSGVKWLPLAPAHWNIERFGRVLKEREERSVSGSETLLSVSAYTGVSPRSEIIDEEDHLTRSDSLIGYKVCYSKDLVINIMLAWNRGLGVSQYHGIVSPAYCVFSISKDVDARFIDYLVRTNEYTAYFKSFSTGVIDSRLRIYPDVLKTLTVIYPNKEEQIKIADYLDHETAKINSLICEQEQLIELLKENRKAVISQAVTKGLDPNVEMKDSGVEWLGKIPVHWITSKLKFLTSRISSGKTPSGGSEIYIDNGVIFLRSQNVYDDGLRLDEVVHISPEIDEQMSSSRVQPGDILINITGASIGRTCIVPTEFPNANVNQHVCVIRLLNCDLIPFVEIFFKSDAIKSQTEFVQNGAAREGLNFDQIGNMKVCIPPADEQTKIVNYVFNKFLAFNRLIGETENAIELLKERRSALISAAVTGQIDVRNVAITQEAA